MQDVLSFLLLLTKILLRCRAVHIVLYRIRLVLLPLTRILLGCRSACVVLYAMCLGFAAPYRDFAQILFCMYGFVWLLPLIAAPFVSLYIGFVEALMKN